MTKNVEERIRDHYLSEDGEWLVEKGKVKEARLLKEAYGRIDDLKNDLQWQKNYARSLAQEARESRDKLDKMAVDVNERERRLEVTKEDIMSVLKRIQEL